MVRIDQFVLFNMWSSLAALHKDEPCLAISNGPESKNLCVCVHIDRIRYDVNPCCCVAPVWVRSDSSHCCPRLWKEGQKKKRSWENTWTSHRHLTTTGLWYLTWIKQSRMKAFNISLKHKDIRFPNTFFFILKFMLYMQHIKAIHQNLQCWVLGPLILFGLEQFKHKKKMQNLQANRFVGHLFGGSYSGAKLWWICATSKPFAHYSHKINRIHQIAVRVRKGPLLSHEWDPPLHIPYLAYLKSKELTRSSESICVTAACRITKADFRN